MKNHTELFQAIQSGTQLDGAAAYIQKTESGYMAKVAGLWKKTGEAIAANGSLQTANELLENLRPLYPANRLGEKCSSLAAAARDCGMAIYYWQDGKSADGVKAKFHATDKPLTKAQEAAQAAKCVKILEADLKKATKEGDKVMVEVCTAMMPEIVAEAATLTAEVAADKAAAEKAAWLQKGFELLMSNTITEADIVDMLDKAEAEKLAALIGTSEAVAA